MSVFVLSPEVVLNPNAFDFKTAPRKLIDRIAILPKREADWRLIARLIFENQFLRYMAALMPFVIAMLTWPHLALPISQAPIPMLIVITLVEMRLLRLNKTRRAALITEDDAARTLDALGFRARQLLTRIAAKRELEAGTLLLVVDQSELATVPPLTVVTVQRAEGGARLVPLDAQERAWIRETLFDANTSETHLHRTNLRADTYMRSFAVEAAAVSAHARLAARLAKPSPTEIPV